MLCDAQAGISLGFNLAGSLAAIDKWVQDMGSEDDETEGEEDDDGPAGAGGAGASADSEDELEGHVRSARRELLFSFGATAAGQARSDRKGDLIGKLAAQSLAFAVFVN